MATINTIKTVLHMMRQEYDFPIFDRPQLRDDPWVLFNEWFAQAEKKELEANAMILSTVSAQGQPSSRVVLLKEISEGGLVFFGNDQSRKMRELTENPKAALMFYWEREKRQVRFVGSCHKILRVESENYFATRPYDSQIGAWASAQSMVVDSRETLEERVLAYQKQYPRGKVPCPPYWGGWRLIPHEIEFWQGRMSRLHDRFVYIRAHEGWDIQRLYP